MSGDKVFVDTNVIVYAYDVSAKEKHEVAQKIIVDLWNSGLGLLSTQVLQEFFVIITKKTSKPHDVKSAREIVSDLIKWDVIVNDAESILGAIGIHSRYKYSFWDAMLIHAAITGGAACLLSEDLSDGQRIKGVEIKNPFKIV